MIMLQYCFSLSLGPLKVSSFNVDDDLDTGEVTLSWAPHLDSKQDQFKVKPFYQSRIESH